MSRTPSPDELYVRELDKLGELAGDYLQAWASDERRELLLLLVGMLTAQCARVYNLAPQAGLLDPRTLFTGKPE